MPTPNERTIEHKAFESFEIKDAEKGDVEACVATTGVVDRDGDIIAPGAIMDGTKVAMSSYGHDAVFGAMPVGKGALAVVGNKVMFKGRLFMNTQGGRETFNVLKEMGPDQEWSFGFHVMDAQSPSDAQMKQGCNRVLMKLGAFEVSPVIMGAGIGTGTTAVKQADGDPLAVEPAAVPPVEAPEAKVAAREDVSPQEGTDKYGDVTFADPTNKKYPIDTEEHIRAAWNYINHPDAADKYSADDLAAIKRRIVEAWKAKIDAAGPPGASEKSADVLEAEQKAAARAKAHRQAAIDEEIARFHRNLRRYQ